MCVSPFTWEQPSADTNSAALRGREGQCPYPIHPRLAWTSHSHTFNSFIYLSWFCLTSLHLPPSSKNLPARGGSVLLPHLEWYPADTNLILKASLWSWMSFQCGLTCLCTNNLHVIAHTRELCKQITSQDILLEVNDVQNFLSWFYFFPDWVTCQKATDHFKTRIGGQENNALWWRYRHLHPSLPSVQQGKTNGRKEMTGKKATRGEVASVDPASTVLFWSNTLPLGQGAPHLHTHLSEDV